LKQNQKITATGREKRYKEMSPQDQSTPAVVTGTGTSDTTPGNEGCLEAQVDLKVRDEELADMFQRAQTDRKRGWHDFQVMLTGEINVLNSFCKLPLTAEELSLYYDLQGWNKFDVNGKDYVVNFVTPPPPWGRYPNYKGTDRALQATDGAIIVVQPKDEIGSIFSWLDPIKDAYEGKNAEFYGIGEHVGEYSLLYSPHRRRSSLH